MTTGKIHDTSVRLFMMPNSILVGLGTYYFSNDLTYSIEIGIITYLGQQFGRLATPDSDQEPATYQDYITEIIDPYFHKFWFYLWWIYGKIVPHRSWISHSIIIGTLIRILYLFILFSPLIGYFGLHNMFSYYWDYSLAFIGGYCLSDINHLALDYIMPLRRFAEKYLG